MRELNIIFIRERADVIIISEVRIKHGTGVIYIGIRSFIIIKSMMIIIREFIIDQIKL